MACPISLGRHNNKCLPSAISSVVGFQVSLCHFVKSDCRSFNCCGEMAIFKIFKMAIVRYLETRYRASTSMYSLTFRVRVMLPWQRNPCIDCKSAQQCTTRGSLYHGPKLHPGPCSNVGVRPRTDTQTDRHRRARPQYILRRLRLTQNVITLAKVPSHSP